MGVEGAISSRCAVGLPAHSQAFLRLTEVVRVPLLLTCFVRPVSSLLPDVAFTLEFSEQSFQSWCAVCLFVYDLSGEEKQILSFLGLIEVCLLPKEVFPSRSVFCYT